MALHEHVISDVIKRLITFASLALRTLEPMFLVLYDDPRFWSIMGQVVRLDSNHIETKIVMDCNEMENTVSVKIHQYI